MLLVDALGGRYLNYRFRTTGRATVRIVERPGRWMDPAALDRLVADCRTVVRSTLSAGALDYGVVGGDRSRLDDAILTVVYAAEDGRPIAFNALSIMACELRGRPTEVLHLGLVMVDPTTRAKGLTAVLYGLTCFLVFARHQMRPLWVSNVTQVPAIFGMVAEQFAAAYPSALPGARRTFDHLTLARQIAARHRHVFGVGPEAGFDEQRFVLTNAYTGGSDNLKKTFEDASKHRHEAHNAWCAAELDYARGDDVLQLAQFTLPAARRHFTRFRSVISPAFLATQFAFLFLESVLAPVAQWLTPTRPMGALRPWRHPAPR
jgi:hypothetical protein